MRIPTRPHPGRRGQVLIILFGVLFLGGSSALAVGLFVTGKSTQQIDKALKREVTDGDRRGAARQVIESWDHDVERFLDGTQERFEELEHLLQRRDAERARIDALLDRQDAAVDDMTRRVLDRRFELRTHLTPPEWRAVFGPGPVAVGSQERR